MSARIARRLSALSARETMARELADIMGTTAREFRDEWRASVPDSLSGKGPDAVNVYGDMTPDYDGTSVRVELRDLTPDMAREVARMVAGWLGPSCVKCGTPVALPGQAVVMFERDGLDMRPTDSVMCIECGGNGRNVR